VSRKTITEDEVVQYAIESIPDDTLGQGEENILQEGQNGRKRVTVDMISIDGQLAGKEIVDSQLINEMQPLIRHVGTKETVEINTGSISKYKAVYTMVATAYLPTDGNGECITKMGTWARRGEIAVDPNVIPLGTVVYIPGYGVATAEDTGGDILGNRIDLCMEDYNECMAFGRRTILVYILD
jgi:3D (Asp-Asp-Asp) domain-containing protein